MRRLRGLWTAAPVIVLIAGISVSIDVASPCEIRDQFNGV
jgi:hypothetical protein